MPPPRRRPDDRPPPSQVRGRPPEPVLLDAEVLDADVLDAEVLDADVLDADVLDAEVVDAASVEAVIEAEVLELEAEADQEPSVEFHLELVDGSPLAPTQASPALPVYEAVPPEQSPTGADLLVLDADDKGPATRTATRPATASRPALKITFVCPGERPPFAPG